MKDSKMNDVAKIALWAVQLSVMHVIGTVKNNRARKKETHDQVTRGLRALGGYGIE